MNAYYSHNAQGCVFTCLSSRGQRLSSALSATGNPFQPSPNSLLFLFKVMQLMPKQTPLQSMQRSGCIFKSIHSLFNDNSRWPQRAETQKTHSQTLTQKS